MIFILWGLLSKSTQNLHNAKNIKKHKDERILTRMTDVHKAREFTRALELLNEDFVHHKRSDSELVAYSPEPIRSLSSYCASNSDLMETGSRLPFNDVYFRHAGTHLTEMGNSNDMLEELQGLGRISRSIRLFFPSLKLTLKSFIE